MQVDSECHSAEMRNLVSWAALGSFAVLAAAMGMTGTSPAAAHPGDGAFAESPNYFECPAQYGLVIHITAGDIDCVTAADFAVQYDQSGDKYQNIGPFTCYSGNAMTQPLLFQCVADTADNAEFAVYPV